MAYYQRNIPNPAKIHSFTLSNFIGGLNNRDQLPQENECTDVMNMSFTQDGLMEKRRGVTYFDDVELSGEIIFIDEYKPHNEESILLRATNTEMYIGSALLRTVNGQVNGVNHQGKYFFCDGSGLFSYGRFDDEASTYVEIIGTQVLDYVLMQVVSPPETYTPLDNTHTKGKMVYDFDNRKVWYEPCENELTDTFKQGNVVPNKPRFIVQREGRLYLAGSDDDDDNVFITDTGNPYYFPASLPIQLPPNSDRISGLAIYQDAVVIGRRLDMHVIVGDTNRTDVGLPLFRLSKLNSHFGFASQKSVVNAHNYLFFLGTDSQFYILRTIEETGEFATQVTSKTVDIHAHPINVSKEDIWYANATFFNDHYYVSIGDKILIYNYLHRAWTVYNHIGATSFYPLFNTLLIGINSGRIVMPSDDYLDLGKPYKAYWRSRWFDNGEATSYKMYRDFFVVTRSSRDYISNVNLLFEVDYHDTTNNFSVFNSFSIYGRTRWGDRYINREINTSLPFQVFRRGRQVRITFWNGEHIHSEVDTLEDLSSIEGIYDGMIVKVISEDKIYTHKGNEWFELVEEEYNQGMCVLQLNGEFEYKWKR